MASLFDTILPINQLNGLVEGAENAVVGLFGFGHAKSNGTQKAATTIDGFKGEVLGKGNASANRFELQVAMPKCITGSQWAQYSIPANYRVEAVNFPALSLILKQRQIFGAPVQMPVGADYGGQHGMTVTYLCDRDMNVKKLFDAWIGSVVDSSTQTVAYPDTYTSQISLAQLDRQDMVVYSISLKDAYPIRVSEMQGNMHSADFQRVQVTYAYRKWQSNEVAYYAAIKAAAASSTTSLASANTFGFTMPGQSSTNTATPASVTNTTTTTGVGSNSFGFTT